MTRSFLFVPADSHRKLARARDAGADALIVDLEDSVRAEARPEARLSAREYLQGKEDVWVRINPMDSDEAIADLESVLPSVPTGIVLPKPRSAADAQKLSEHLDVHEKKLGISAGSTRILPLCTERPEALFSLDSYVGATPRLAGLSWGAEDLAAAIGASDNRDDNGDWLPTFEMARSLCLVAAAAAEVAAYDTVFTDFRNDAGLQSYAANARRDGFAGMLAIHPAQVQHINTAFVPSPKEIEHAERIVALFDASPGTGTVGLDGKMIDRPHLLQAHRILQLAERAKT